MILTKEITHTDAEWSALSPCTEGGDDNTILMQGTEVKSCTQYMSAVYILRGCYELLQEAGFNVLKDESDQSLTIWGLKLKFANLCHYDRYVKPGTTADITNPEYYWPYININAPDINYTMSFNTSNNTSFVMTKTNYFLQRSMKASYANASTDDSANSSTGIAGLYYRHAGIMHPEGCNQYSSLGSATCMDIARIQDNIYQAAPVDSYYTNSDNQNCRTVILYLYCSNDGIQICYKINKKTTDQYSKLQPLLSVYKGKNVLNDKNILVVGQMLEKAPYIFCTDSNTAYFGWRATSYGNLSYFSHANTSHIHNLWNPFASAYACSGSNLIYEYDEENSKWEKTDETLYLDVEDYGNLNNKQIVNGVATANYKKYEIYGIAKVCKIDKSTIADNFYEIDGKKYWCRYGYLQKAYNNLTTYLGEEYDVTNIISYTGSSNNSYVTSINIQENFLDFDYNSFGYGVMNKPITQADFNNLVETKNWGNRFKKHKVGILNPYIFVRLDDEIIDE